MDMLRAVLCHFLWTLKTVSPFLAAILILISSFSSISYYGFRAALIRTPPTIPKPTSQTLKKNTRVQSKMENIFTQLPHLERDGINLRWSHRTNTPDSLQTALKSSHVQLIEADIIFCEETSRPVMAHPPAKTSNFSLEEFLKMIKKILASPVNRAQKKGFKLDFKSLKAARHSLPIIEAARLEEVLKGQLLIVWLNADILPGRGKDKALVSGPEFLSACEKKIQKTYPLSVGWSVPFRYDHPNASYTPQMMAEMEKLITENTRETAEITLAIRAGYLIAQSSRDTVLEMMLRLWASEESTGRSFSLTLWHSTEDERKNGHIAQVLAGFRRDSRIRRDRILYDLPDAIISKIQSLESSSKI